MKRIVLIHIIIALALSAEGSAQSIRPFPNYGQLPGPVVRKALQDAEGYMWYSTTESGIMRDNGYQIDVFNGEATDGYSRSDHFVNDISLTPDSKVLYATHTGAWVLDKRTYKVKPFARDIISGMSVNAIVAATDTTVWLTSHSMVYHFTTDGQLIRSYETTRSGEVQSDISLFEDSQRRIWLLKSGGALCLYNNKVDAFDTCRWDYDKAPICMLEDTSRKCFWIGTQDGGVVRYQLSDDDPQRAVLTSFSSTQTGGDGHRAYVFSLTLAGNHLWTATPDDIYAYHIAGGDLVPENLSQYLPASRKIISSLSKDRDGNIWVASYTPKPFIISRQDFHVSKLNIPQMESRYGFPLIADAIARENGGMWLLQSRKGLVHYDMMQGVLTDRIVGASRNMHFENKIERRKRGEGVWIITNERDVCSASIVDGAIVLSKAVSMGSLANCLCETDGGMLYVGTSKGIVKIDPKRGRQLLSFSDAGAVSDIKCAEDGRVFFTSYDKGLAYVAQDGRTVSLNTDYHYDKVGIIDKTTVVASSTEGVVMLCDVPSGKCKVLNMASDNKGCVIKEMKVDDAGHVWILTSLYVKEYNPGNGAFRVLYASDSMFDTDYFLSIAIDGADVCFSGAGSIFMMSSSGVLEQSSPNVVPRVSGYAFRGSRMCMPYGLSTLTLEPDSTQMVVFLTTSDLMNAANVQYAYRLGTDEEWTYLPVGMNGVPLTQLGKGKHVMQAMATNSDGTWSKPVDVLVINRLPHWWESWWAYMLYAAVLLALLLLAFGMMAHRIKAKRMEEMERRVTEMKFRFFTNMSHDLRTPLTLIITPLSSIIKNMDEGGLRTKLENIKTSADELMQMINKLLAFRKLELGETTLQLQYGTLTDFVCQACVAFGPLCEKKGISLVCQTGEEDINCYFDKNLIHHIVYNLLSNAQKYTPTGGRITVAVRHAAVDGSMACISVQDTGIGISKEDCCKIFDRYFQSNQPDGNMNDGTGIGLNIVSEYAAIHQGRVEVESELGVGSTFRVFIPLHLKRQTSSRLLAGGGQTPTPSPDSCPSQSSAEDGASPITHEADDEKTTVLVVEDNEELLNFIACELSRQYRVKKATDGLDALAIAEETQIDVVVTDVMMPGIDGFELCRRIKQNENTSHIPVIMLTAMGGQENELAGYQHGADYYLTKPFETEILFRHLEHIERIMAERRNALQNSDPPDVATLYQDEIDRKTMTKVLELIELNMSNSDYSVEQLSSDMCMSRVTLYRKIKALTGQSPQTFIRMCRLKRAEQLLRSTELSMAEISEMAGFVTASNFSRLFRNQFGTSASEYRKTTRNKKQ